MAENVTQITLTGIEIPFWSIVKFMVKWAIASIPAVIIVSILMAVCLMVLGLASDIVGGIIRGLAGPGL